MVSIIIDNDGTILGVVTEVHVRSAGFLQVHQILTVVGVIGVIGIIHRFADTHTAGVIGKNRVEMKRSSSTFMWNCFQLLRYKYLNDCVVSVQYNSIQFLTQRFRMKKTFNSACSFNYEMFNLCFLHLRILINYVYQYLFHRFHDIYRGRRMNRL